MRHSLRIMGGLGNQLFQYFASLYIAIETGSEIDLLVHKNLSLSKVPINHYLIDKRCHIKHESGALRRIMNPLENYSAKLHLSKNRTENSRFSLLDNSISIMNSILNRKFTKVIFAHDLGFIDPKISSKTKLIGYFQSYKYFEFCLSSTTVTPLVLRSPSEKLKLLTKQIGKSRPLIVHIRRNDYRSEPSFGLLSMDYYHREIDNLMKTNRYEEIWLFSDEPSFATDFVPLRYQKNINSFETIGLSNVEILELMRYGAGYIIANSSFSYWGAMLSYVSNPVVIAPEPWFKIIADPLELIPSYWLRSSSIFE